MLYNAARSLLSDEPLQIQVSAGLVRACAEVILPSGYHNNYADPRTVF